MRAAAGPSGNVECSPWFDQRLAFFLAFRADGFCVKFLLQNVFVYPEADPEADPETNPSPGDSAADCTPGAPSAPKGGAKGFKLP